MTPSSHACCIQCHDRWRWLKCWYQKEPPAFHFCIRSVCVCVFRSHFGSRYRHRFLFVGTFVFWLFWYSAVLVLWFTAGLLLPLVHSLH